MYYKEYRDKLIINKCIFDKYNMGDIAFFDIETTGFDKDQDKVILISLGEFLDDSTYCVKQFFAEGLCEENEVLQRFKEHLSKFDVWCSYNGIAFDEPFIKRRMDKNYIDFSMPSNHIDLYRLIRPYYKQLGMERCNLKTVEKYLGIERQDKIDGGISVQLYYKFLQSKKEDIKDVLMLHNYEDVLNLPKIFQLVYKVDEECKLIREDCITEKQLKYLNHLILKNKLELNIEIERISKKAAARVIDAIVKNNYDIEILNNIINNSY